MKYYPGHEKAAMPEHSELLLADLREQRHFDPELYLDAKATVLNNYMAEAGLSSCVVALSGGIDSAVVAGIIKHAKDQPDSPIEKIYAITEPVFREDYTKNQGSATFKAQEVADAFGLELSEIDLTKAYDALKTAVDDAIGEVGEPWAAGQLVAYLRTPAIYYVTSLMTQRDQSGIVCGTTNRDEGAYLGYVGKASDGIVDVQLISDLHKSEVRKLAHLMGVPASVIEAAPTGDMFDGRIDEEVFGAGYDYVELMLLLKSLPDYISDRCKELLDDDARQKLDEAFNNLEELHSYNAHKYNVGSPAVHLDVMESGVPNGWTYGRIKVGREPENPEYFVNPFELSAFTRELIRKNIVSRNPHNHHSIDLPKGSAVIMDGVLDDFVISSLLSDADCHGWMPADKFGDTKKFKDGDDIWSLRASVFSPELADLLWSKISRVIEPQLIAGSDPQNVIQPGSVWRPIGVSPLNRLIGYEQGGALIPHYDSTFSYSDKQKTFKSLVVYLQEKEMLGGTTRFIEDDRIDIPVSERDLKDRKEIAAEKDVLAKVSPIPGSALIFDHVLLHDGEAIRPVSPRGRKVILRTDVVYVKC